MLALPLGDGSNPVVLSPFALCPSLARNIEPAGRVFEEMVRHRNCDPFFEEDEKEDEEDNTVLPEDTTEYEWEKEFKASQMNKKSDPFSVNKENFYQILGIDDLFLNAKPEDIRKAYKKLVLLYHPDKNKDNISLEGLSQKEEEVKEDAPGEEKLTDEQKKQKEINQKWLKIKEAYETLLDPEKRKKYDSTIEFDDSIPEDNKEYDEKSFFITFGPVFLKNSIWSKKKPVPKIGDMSTPMDKVKRFYRFWYNFQSWRDFSVEGEYNLEEAGSRYEKRQMLKENKKMKSNLLKEEKGRLDRLVQLAYKHDPRIKAEEEKERKIKEEEKKERLMQKQKEKEEEEKRKKMLLKQHEEEQKKQQEMLIKQKEDLSKNLINIGKELGINFTSEEIFLLNLNSKIETLKAVIKDYEDEKDEKAKKKQFVQNCKFYFAMKLKVDDIEDSKGDGVTWTKEEIILLQKAVKKFPAGTKNRWDKIKEIVRTKQNDDIIQMTHYLLTNPNIKIDGDINLAHIMRKEKEKKQQTDAPKTATAENWSSEEQKLLEEALKKFPSSLPANERWTNISKHVGKTKKQCVERYKYLASLVKKNK